MPSYTVPINGPNGPGFITVNASSPQAAIDNANASGNTVPQGAQAQEGGHQAHTGTGGTAVAGYPAGYGPSGAPGTSPPGTTPGTPPGFDPAAWAQYSKAYEDILRAVAARDERAFQEAVRQFDVTFGLDRDKFSEAIRQFNEGLDVTAAGLTGTYHGMQTQQAQQQAHQQALDAAGLTGLWQGAPTLAAQQQRFAQQMAMIQAAQQAQANPFRQQAMLGQMGRLLGGQGVVGFGQLNVVPGVGLVGQQAGGQMGTGMGYLQQMIDDIRGGGASNTASMNSILEGIPTPNKINSPEFFRSPTTTQSMVLQGMQEKYGIDPNDALQQIKNTMPGFQAPATFGTVRR